jgi:hypothetical protein
VREEIITTIALVIAAIMGYLTYKKRMGGMTKNQKFIANAKQAGNYTIGQYDDSVLQFGNRESTNLYRRSDRMKVRYKYRVKGVDYYKTLFFQDPGKISIDYPYNITVYYDPQNPKKAVCPEEATKKQQLESGCLASMGITLLTLFVVFHVLKFFLD